jgi:hypothetical protein
MALFVNAQNPILLDVENCYFENVLFGVYVRGYGGNRDGTETITILNNRGRNILGLKVMGTTATYPAKPTGSGRMQSSSANMPSVPGITDSLERNHQLSLPEPGE